MKLARARAVRLDELLDETDSVLDTAAALGCLSAGELRWRVASGRWRQPFKGAIVAHNGPLTEGQLLRLALLRSCCGLDRELSSPGSPRPGWTVSPASATWCLSPNGGST
jgi:hypothetical protein